jgi:hypothetical protein
MAKNRVVIFNPGKRRRAKARKAKRNPLSELIFMSNPRGKKRRHHINIGGGKKRRRNPGRRSRAHIFSRSKNHRRNPSRHQSSEGFKGWAELGGGGLVGLFASNYLAEMFFGASNSGITGYAITGGIGLAIALLGGKFLGKKFATGAGLGTLLAVAYRAYQDYSNTPTGKLNAVAQNKGLPVGNSDFSGGMGTYVNVAFPFPAAYQWAGGPGAGLQLAPGMPSLQPPAAIPAASGYPPAGAPIGALERDARY